MKNRSPSDTDRGSRPKPVPQHRRRARKNETPRQQRLDIRQQQSTIFNLAHRTQSGQRVARFDVS